MKSRFCIYICTICRGPILRFSKNFKLRYKLMKYEVNRIIMIIKLRFKIKHSYDNSFWNGFQTFWLRTHQINLKLIHVNGVVIQHWHPVETLNINIEKMNSHKYFYACINKIITLDVSSLMCLVIFLKFVQIIKS